MQSNKLVGIYSWIALQTIDENIQAFIQKKAKAKANSVAWLTFLSPKDIREKMANTLLGSANLEYLNISPEVTFKMLKNKE